MLWSLEIPRFIQPKCTCSHNAPHQCMSHSNSELVDAIPNTHEQMCTTSAHMQLVLEAELSMGLTEMENSTSMLSYGFWQPLECNSKCSNASRPCCIGAAK